MGVVSAEQLDRENHWLKRTMERSHRLVRDKSTGRQTIDSTLPTTSNVITLPFVQWTGAKEQEYGLILGNRAMTIIEINLNMINHPA